MQGNKSSSEDESITDETMEARNRAGSVTEPEGLDVLVKALGSGGRYGLLLRDSRVLCAIPTDRETAMHTLDLYQPQRWRARLLKTGVKWAVKGGFHALVLKPFVQESGPETACAPEGVLIGSSGHLCDRAVKVRKGPFGWEVIKLGFGDRADEILSREAEILRALGGEPWLPRCLSYESGDGKAELRMSWHGGQAWNGADLAPLFSLMTGWLQRGAPRRLDAFPEWGWIRPVLERRASWVDRIGRLSDITMRPAVRHGDLTRPNLRLDKNDGLIVHDWERGSLEGIPGLDLVHFLLQDRMFRGNPTPAQAVAGVRAELESRPCAEWLVSCGWNQDPGALIALCLAMNTGAGYMDQGALLNSLEV